MASISLSFVSKTDKAALYATSSSPILYFLYTKVSSSEDSITFEDAWTNMPGAFFYSGKTITSDNASTFIAAFQAVLSKYTDSNRWLAWVPNPDDLSDLSAGNNIIPGKGSGGTYVIGSDGGNASFYNLEIGVAPNTIMTLATGATETSIQIIAGGGAGNSIQLKWGGTDSINNSTQIPLKEPKLTIPVEGTQAGTCQYQIFPSQGDFYLLFANTDASTEASAGPEIRYTYGANSTVETLRFPFYPGINPKIGTSSNTKLYPLMASLDPIAPLDSSRTYFDLNFDAQFRNNSIYAYPESTYFNDNFGFGLTLTPVDGSGFGLGLRPADTDSSELYVFLTPKGPYQLSKEGDTDNSLIQVLCGINSTEFLLLAEGDYINISNDDNPSNADKFSVATTEPINNIDQLTTLTSASYLSVKAGANQSTAFANTPFKESYCVQAEGLIFFNEISGQYYAGVAGCRIGDLSGDVEQTPFPMVPYGGIFFEDTSKTIKNPNQRTFGTWFEDYENSVISPNRRACIAPDLCMGPLFFDLTSPSLDALTGYMLTSNGLLIHLNEGTSNTQPKGTCQELILAKSPINDDQFLKIGASDDSGDCTDTQYEVLNPYLSNAILSNAPMIVVTQDKFGTLNGNSAFLNALQMDEFTFEIDLSRNDSLADGEEATIFLFKLDTNYSVEQLAQMNSLWAYSEYFVGDESAVETISTQISDTITEAKGKDQRWFGDFVDKMTNPNWTGVIALNCSLDYQELPIDILMLLGGIEGSLMAHHFGLTVNRINDNASPTEIPIESSSLFALVYYDKDTPTQYNDDNNHFETLILNALFTNSTLSDFESKIAMTIPKMFEEYSSLSQYTNNDGNWEEVTLQVPNVIEISGVYQAPKDPNGIGSVVFNSDDHFVFSFETPSSGVRVLEQIVITDAALIPISESYSGENEGSQLVTSYFELKGGIGFVASVGKDSNNNNSPIDIFSFGTNIAFTEKGLGLNGYNFQIETSIDGNTATLVNGIPTLYEEIRLFIQDDSGNDQSRTDSLYATMPLAFEGFMYNLDSGISPQSVDGVFMQGIGLPDDNSGSLEKVNPNFAFQVKMNIGSLGALVSKDILEAEMIIGWQASGSEKDSPKANKVAMIFQPPDGFTNDTGFYIEGVFRTVFDNVVLDRYPYSSEADDLLFVVTLTNANFQFLNLDLLKSNAGFTFFGQPDSPSSSNLAWFIGDPTHDDSDSSSDLMSLGSSSSFFFYPSMGLMSAVELRDNKPLDIDIIGDTIDDLLDLPIETAEFIKDLFSDDDFLLKYNSDVKVFLWLQAKFASVTLNGIFNDPSFYGGQLTIASNDDSAEEDDNGEDDNGNDDKKTKGIMSALKGLSLSFLYRKINDHLGEYSGQLTLPDKFRKFKIGEIEFELPTIGLAIWTNGDFKFAIGWPFASQDNFAPTGDQFKVVVPIEGVPVAFISGFYFAKLRSEDAPAVFVDSDFNLIYMFGIGIGAGVSKEGKSGPFSYSAEVVVYGTLEGMLASISGEITNDGIDFYWFAGQIGVSLSLEGKVDLKVIKASVGFQAALMAGLALERYHKSLFTAKFHVEFEFKLKVLFFTVKYEFSTTFTLFTFTFGGDYSAVAELTGPTPPFSAPTQTSESLLATNTFNESFELATVLTSDEPVALNLYLLLQPTAVYNSSQSKFLSNVVASALISTDDFNSMVQTLIPYVVTNYGGGSSDLTTQLNNTLAALNTIETSINTIVGDLFTFTVNAGSSVNSEMDVAIFALPEGFGLSYNGQSINFDANTADADYLTEVQDYFNQLQADETTNLALAETTETPVIQILFENYFGMIVQTTIQDMLAAIQDDPSITTVSAALAQITLSNISGSVSRNMQAGLQLPKPSDLSELSPMYVLTQQQVEVAYEDSKPVTDFELVTNDDKPSWITLAGGEDSLKETLDSSLILDPSNVNDDWANNASALDPLFSYLRTFQLTTTQTWANSAGTTYNLRPFTDDLNNLITNQSSGNNPIFSLLPLELGTDSNTSINGTACLKVDFKLQRIPAGSVTGSDNSGAYLENVYQVIGTDENTRELIQNLLNDSNAKITGFDFLTASSDSAYSSSSSYANGLLVRTNLSTESVPDGVSFAEAIVEDGLTATSDLGPLQARLNNEGDNAKNFLRLMWEVSIVHTSGYYLQIDDVDESLFGSSGLAGVSLLVQIGAAAETLTLPYPSYYNALLADGSEVGSRVGVSLKYKDGSDVLVYQANYPAGTTAFKVETTTSLNPTPSDAQDYIDAIYQFIQYKINSISGVANFTPTNWSMPNGASTTQGDNELLLSFRQIIPVSKFVSSENPYSAVGKKANVTVRLLDMFGNALPSSTDWNTDLLVEYNDPLIPVAQWQGIGLSYQVLPVNGAPQLVLNVTYSDNGIKDQNDSNGTGLQSPLQKAISDYQWVYYQLTDPNVSATISTSLASSSFANDSNGNAIVGILADFVKEILTYLQSSDSTATPPTSTQITADLEQSFISTIANDIFKLTVDLTIARDASKVNTEISDLLASVLFVNSSVAEYQVNSNEETSDQSSLLPFAQDFESAYEGFAGSNTWLKLAQGPKLQTSQGTKLRELYAVRWGSGAGIYIDFPNADGSPTAAQQPVYFSPTPLSTVLLTDTFSHLYDYGSGAATGIPENSNVTRSFSNVDLDQWGRYCLNQVQVLLSPPLANAIAELSGSTDYYSQFIAAKESLAESITGEVRSVLEYTDLTPDGTEAKNAFQQSLLNSLSTDYTTSSIVQIPATVSVKSSTSSTPPNLYGKVSEGTQTDQTQVYTLSASTLAAENASEQFAFLASAKRPEDDAFLNLDNLFFNIAFVEFEFEDAQSTFGFTPSSWLTFVIPDGQPLQQSMGAAQVPIPLRSFPSDPVLLSQSQVTASNTSINIQDSLLWTYQLEMGKPQVAQDELNFTIQFNEQLNASSSSTASLAETRPAPENLFEALARFTYEYPQLTGQLSNIVDAGNGENTNGDPTQVLAQILELVQGVANTWATWENPSVEQLKAAEEPGLDIISWSYALINNVSEGTLSLTRSASTQPWPSITGYTGSADSGDSNKYIYKPNGTSASLNSLTLSFADLYIMTHQSVNVQAYIKRNDDLVPSSAPTGTTVDTAFIYVTETVTFGSVFVPINQNQTLISLEDKGSITANLEALFDNFIANPNDSSETLNELKFDLFAKAQFTLAVNASIPDASIPDNLSNKVNTNLPLLLSKEDVATPSNTTGEPSLSMDNYIKTYLAPAIQSELDKLSTKTVNDEVLLQMTLFANVSNTQLPLVVYTQLALPVD